MVRFARKIYGLTVGRRGAIFGRSRERETRWQSFLVGDGALGSSVEES